jgi:hypothetical protein
MPTLPGRASALRRLARIALLGSSGTQAPSPGRTRSSTQFVAYRSAPAFLDPELTVGWDAYTAKGSAPTMRNSNSGSCYRSGSHLRT